MGVLEEAIREHLDLKRKHGASDAELNQQEAEALGPARREAAEAEVAEEHPEAVQVVEPVVEPPVESAPEVEEAPVEPAPVEEPELAEPEATTHEDDPDPDFGGEAPDQ